MTLLAATGILLSLLSANASASSKTINEGVAATGNTVFVDTVNTRVDIATRTYGGPVASVGLYVSSNVVISNSAAASNVVIYATGSMVIGGSIVPSTTPISGTYVTLTGNSESITGSKTFGSTVTLSGRVVGPQIVTSWALFVSSDTSGTLMASVNVTSVTFISGAIYRVNFSTPMASAYYATTIMADYAGSVAMVCGKRSNTEAFPRSIDVACYDPTTGGAANPNKINVMVVGTQ